MKEMSKIVIVMMKLKLTNPQHMLEDQKYMCRCVLMYIAMFKFKCLQSLSLYAGLKSNCIYIHQAHESCYKEWRLAY